MMKKTLFRFITVKRFRHKERLRMNKMRVNFLSDPSRRKCGLLDQYIYNEIFSTIISTFSSQFLFQRFLDESVLYIRN